MIHTFDRAGTERLLEDDPATVKPGLWLVGDDGVYLMSNGVPSLSASSPALPDNPFEVNPRMLDFDVWWERKRAGFGGDDGAEFLPADNLMAALKTYRPGEPLKLDISSKGISVVTYRSPRKALKKPR